MAKNMPMRGRKLFKADGIQQKITHFVSRKKLCRRIPNPLQAIKLVEDYILY